MGEAVARRWDATDGDTRAFATLAEAVLVEHAPHLGASFTDLVDWALFAPSLPPQKYRSFGQPPLNLHVGAGFHIEANVWLDAITTVHRHAFSGAFCMLVGRSLHTRYRFSEEERINAHLRLGQLSLIDAEILAPGCVRRIEPGDGLTHSALHLDRPSVSIVIRTEGDIEAGPQLNHLPPSVAVDARIEREPLRTRLELLDALAVAAPERHFPTLIRMLDTDNRYVVYRVLERAFRRIGQTERWPPIEALAIRRHGTFVDRVCASLREEHRQDSLVARRARVPDERLRLLLALLTVLPSRDAIYRVVREHEPALAPEDWVLTVVAQLAEAGALGIPLDPISLEILRCLLRGCSLEEMVPTLVARFPTAAIGSRLAEVDRAAANLRRSPVLQPLFVAEEAISS